MSTDDRDQLEGAEPLRPRAQNPRAQNPQRPPDVGSSSTSSVDHDHSRPPISDVNTVRFSNSEERMGERAPSAAGVNPAPSGAARRSPGMAITSLMSAPSPLSAGARATQTDSSAADPAQTSVPTNSSSFNNVRHGISPSSHSMQSQTTRTNSTASSSTGASGLHDLRTAPLAPPPMLTGLPHHSSERRAYKLIIRQQPQQGRLCGLGSKDKRPLDPLPILQLQILKEDGTEDEDAENSPNLVLQVSLRKQDMVKGTHAEAVLVESNDTAYPWTRMLEGRLVASANVARDMDGSRACFFVFTDLSIRQEGHFRLAFKLIALGGPSPPGTGPSSPGGQVLAEALTEPFAIYSPRRFPGMTESTELAKCLARQGIQVPVRNDVRRRQEPPDSHTASDDRDLD